jgi:hypothetical protein
MSVSSFDEKDRRLKERLQRRTNKTRNCIQRVEMLAVAIVSNVCESFKRKIG